MIILLIVVEMMIDRVPVSVSEWLLGSFVLILSICPTQPIFTNTESAMLSNVWSFSNNQPLSYNQLLHF